jgi:tetratricopeptide (TPR) repeat protein
LSLVHDFCQAGTGKVLLLLACLTLASCASVKPMETRLDDAETSEAPSEQPTDNNLPPVDLTADLMYRILLADIARQRGNDPMALSALVDSAKTTRDPRLAAQATRQAISMAEYDVALDMSRLWVELAPDKADAQQTLGNLYVLQQQADQAIVHYRQSITLSRPEHQSLVLQQMSETLLRYADKEDALAVMRQLAEENPDSAAIALSYASVAGRLQEIDTASASVDRALTLKPDWEDAAVFKFNLLQLQQQDKAAEDFALGFLAKNKDAESLRITLARHYLEHDDLKQAEKQYRLVYSQNPESPGTVLALALLRLQDNDLDEAQIYLERLLELQAESDTARIYLGDIALKRDRLDEAEQWYRAVTTSDQLFSARIRLSAVIKQRDGVDAALRELEAVFPENASQQVDLALLRNEMLSDAGRLQEAYTVMTEALEDQPDNVELLYARAMDAAQMKDVAGLERDLHRLLEIKPDHTHALNALGYTLADLTDRYDEALKYVTMALQQKPDDPFILDSMGWVKYRMGDLDTAEQYLRRALELRNDPEIASHLTEVLWQQGAESEARAIWNKANGDFPGNKLLREVHDRLLEKPSGSR